VVITGSGFTGAYEVTFGDASSVPFTVVSNSEITVVSPPLGGGDASAPLLVFASGPPAFSPYDFTYETP
jgi:hypothetical protein